MTIYDLPGAVALLLQPERFFRLAMATFPSTSYIGGSSSTAAQQQDYSTPHHTSQGGTSFIMARGNQRDLARQKNMKKQKDLAKSQKKNGDPKKRMESDADILRQKQAAADARREAELLEKLKAEKARK